MASTPLISTAELAACFENPDLRVIDCRFDLSDIDAGQRAFVLERIPGARYAHLNQDLSDLSQMATHGRHPLPGMSSLSASLSRLGINRHSWIVAYDQDSGAHAARLWWLLRSTGFQQAQVLDGGFSAWMSESRPTECGPPARYHSTPLPERLHLRVDSHIATAQLQRGLAAANLMLIDARAEARFRGEVEPLDKVAGHVPGAINRPYPNNLAPDGRFKHPHQLRAEFEALLDGQSPKNVVHMCGSGVTACHNRLAMDVAGLGGSRLYPDSWSGWITDPDRPIAVGA